MSSAELVAGGCSYRVSMAGNGGRAEQGLEGTGGAEASRVSVKTLDTRKGESKTTDVESRQVVAKKGEN